ncbi:hypothetical protein OOJ91_22895 [Micromonospora lupini]|uniref:hypothetical protein n=1 Tax=Micromonospora lupini TaxID=285679 RepID=UPI00225967C4|nr:hypothetical protein [Micromonospora lupini]MCX5068692.1 hypothetical protein [Micromonospora lupini]
MATIGYQVPLTNLVEPDEQVLAVAKAEIAQGVQPADPPVTDPPAAQRPARSGAAGVASGVLLNLLVPLLSFPAGDRIVDRVIFGVAGRGAPGSAASTLRYARRPAPPVTSIEDTILAVTDRRLLVCASGPVTLWSSRADDERAAAETRIVWSVPRPTVADARVGWHRLNPKRLRIEFTDGSWLAFTVPLAEPGKPLREVAAALTSR